MSNRRRGPGLLERRANYLKSLQVVDYRLIISVLFLLMFGVIMVYSASSAQYGNGYTVKQFLFAVLGVVAMLFVSYFDYHHYLPFAVLVLLAAIFSLFLVKVPGLGVSVNGASRWISILGITLQPSELVKPAIVLYSASVIIDKKEKLATPEGFAYYFIPAFAAAFLIYTVTDNLSTAVIVLAISAIMFFVAYPYKRIWLWLILLAALAAAAIWYIYTTGVVPAHMSGDTDSFRLLRILAWLYPEEYQSASMQSRYSVYAIGFGGLWGRGLGSGTIKYYLPEPMNDFIFAVIAEELGIVGCAALIFMFAYQVSRIWTVARHGRDLLGNYLALGIGAHVAVQVILNIGVASNLLPNTGISLPYISYGGTALLLQMAEIGVVLNVSRQIPGRRIPDEEAGQPRHPGHDSGETYRRGHRKNQGRPDLVVYRGGKSGDER